MIAQDEGYEKYERIIQKLAKIRSDVYNLDISFANNQPRKNNMDDLTEIKHELIRLDSELIKTIIEFNEKEDPDGLIRIEDEFDKTYNLLNEIDVNLTKLKEGI